MHLLSLKNAFRARLPSKLHRQLLHQHHLQCQLHCENDPTVTNHNGILSTAHVRKTVKIPFTMRNRSDYHPTTHDTVLQPSQRRDRSSRFGDGLCTEKHRFRASAIFQKRISYETSFKNSIGNSSTSTTLQCHLHCRNDPTVANHNGMPSAIHPPAPLTIPFTLRERSYSYKSQWHSFHH